ncbi:MAG: hypothetical protein GF381_02805 [Candidatus Pacebacteria bacterium]|nr:hypothetical protein [Candidatus Paceibacterota bacterium]
MSLIQQQFNKYKQQKSVLALMIFTFVIVIFWAGLKIFESQLKVFDDRELIELAKPLTPRIDEKLFDQIEQEATYSQQELQSFEIYTLRTQNDGGLRLTTVGAPEPTPTQVQAASPTPIKSDDLTDESNQASPSAQN